MADPPPYEGSDSKYRHSIKDRTLSDDELCHISIREELGAGQQQRVAVVVSNLLPQVRSRAQRGLAKTAFILFPANREETTSGTLVGHSDEIPRLVQMEEDADAFEFWMQQDAISLLQSLMYDAVAGDKRSERPEQAIPAAPEPGVPKKSSFWNRKNARPISYQIRQELASPQITVTAQSDEANFRSETEYGLYQTQRVKCVSLSVEIGK